MQAFLAACAVAIVVAVGSIYILDSVQRQASQAYTAPSSVRL